MLISALDGINLQLKILLKCRSVFWTPNLHGQSLLPDHIYQLNALIHNRTFKATFTQLALKPSKNSGMLK